MSWFEPSGLCSSQLSDLYGLSHIQPRLQDTPVPDSPDFYHKKKLQQKILSTIWNVLTWSRKLGKFEVKCSKKCCCPQKCSELHLQYSEHFGYLQLRKSTSIMCLYFSYFLVSLWIWVLSSFGLFQIFIFSVFTQYSVVSVKILSRAWLMFFCSIMTVLLCKSCKLLNTDWSKKVDIASLLLNLIASFAIKQTRIMQGHKRYTKVNTCKDYLLK